MFELLNFKESLLLKKTKDAFNVKTVTRKRTNTNRVATEKVLSFTRQVQHPPPTSHHSAEKKHSTNKIVIRGGGYSK